MREGLSAEGKRVREEQQRNTRGCVIVQAKKLGSGGRWVSCTLAGFIISLYLIWFPLFCQRHSFATGAEVNLNHIGL